MQTVLQGWEGTSWEMAGEEMKRGLESLNPAGMKQGEEHRGAGQMGCPQVSG
jgi:hypothetical protein